MPHVPLGRRAQQMQPQVFQRRTVSDGSPRSPSGFSAAGIAGPLLMGALRAEGFDYPVCCLAGGLISAAPLFRGGGDGALCGEDPALESGEGTLRFGRRCGARPPLRPRGASTASSPPSVFSRFADLPLHMPGALTASSFALAAMSFIACPKRASFSLRLGLDVVLLGWSARATVVFRDIKHATPLRQGIAAGAAESFRDPPGFGTPTSW